MKRIWMTALALAGACLGPCSALAQGAVQLRFATAGPGSAWHDYSTGIADLLKEKLPAGSSIETKGAPGAIATIKMVQGGKAEIGFGFAHTAASACSGTGIFKEKQGNLRALVGGLDAYYFATFVTKRSGVTGWEEIAEAKNKFWLLTLKAGSMGEQGVRQVLALLGSSKEAVVDKGGFVEATARSATPRQIKDGLAEGWASVVPRGHPMANQMASLVDMAVLPLPDNVISGMVAKHGWVETVMPANTYKGQTQAVRTVKSATNLLASPSLPDEVAYIITKAIVESAGAALAKVHVALSDFNPSQATDTVLHGGCPLHPGAARYYKEAGILK
jgi:TRAP transporter TAXI family solute receptor